MRRPPFSKGKGGRLFGFTRKKGGIVLGLEVRKNHSNTGGNVGIDGRLAKAKNSPASGLERGVFASVSSYGFGQAVPVRAINFDCNLVFRQGKVDAEATDRVFLNRNYCRRLKCVVEGFLNRRGFVKVLMSDGPKPCALLRAEPSLIECGGLEAGSKTPKSFPAFFTNIADVFGWVARTRTYRLVVEGPAPGSTACLLPVSPFVGASKGLAAISADRRNRLRRILRIIVLARTVTTAKLLPAMPPFVIRTNKGFTAVAAYVSTAKLASLLPALAAAISLTFLHTAVGMKCLAAIFAGLFFGRAMWVKRSNWRKGTVSPVGQA